MRAVPDVVNTPREVPFVEVGDFGQLDERVSAVKVIFGSVVGVNDGYIEWCPDDVTPTEQVVLAVSPRSRVSLFEGEGYGPDWTCKSLFNIANVFPESGFIVLKLEPRTGSKNYGIGQVLPDGIGGESFIVRRSAAVPVFQARPGEVSFVGGFRLTRAGERMRIEPDEETTVEDAKRYLKTAYPALAGNVTYAPLVFMRADGGC